MFRSYQMGHFTTPPLLGSRTDVIQTWGVCAHVLGHSKCTCHWRGIVASVGLTDTIRFPAFCGNRDTILWHEILVFGVEFCMKYDGYWWMQTQWWHCQKVVLDVVRPSLRWPWQVAPSTWKRLLLAGPLRCHASASKKISARLPQGGDRVGTESCNWNAVTGFWGFSNWVQTPNWSTCRQTLGTTIHTTSTFLPKALRHFAAWTVARCQFLNHQLEEKHQLSVLLHFFADELTNSGENTLEYQHFRGVSHDPGPRSRRWWRWLFFWMCMLKTWWSLANSPICLFSNQATTKCVRKQCKFLMELL